jgi:putative NADPH-quinone reductase
MGGRRVLLIQGHPDISKTHLCHALAERYARAATQAGHAVRRVDVATLDFPLLRSSEDWEHGSVPPGLAQAQDDIHWAEHLLLFFPLWLGDMPALLKGFLEQVARPGFAFTRDGGSNPFGHKALTGRSARVVVTMGMPSLVYRYYFMAHSVRSLERNILGFVGIAPVDETLIGMVGQFDDERAARWLERMDALGAAAD